MALTLKISVNPKVYRHIRINDNATLHTLHKIILDSLDFDDDHLHSFFMNNVAWDSAHEYGGVGVEINGCAGLSAKAKLSDFDLKKGSKFLEIFDFGDEWEFQISVLDTDDKKIAKPEIIKSVGEIEQYKDYDDDE